MMINTVYAVGSTGKIVKQISDKAQAKGHRTLIAHRYAEEGVESPDNVVEISSWWDCHVHNRLAHLTMLRGSFSRLKTRSFIKKAKKFAPDIIHLHNVHGSFINLSMLFRYIKESGARLIWTFHDCWPLTGYCKYFDMAGCERWRDGCGKCPQKEKALIDLSSRMLSKKQRMFGEADNVTIVTPSVWLAELVKSSYLGVHDVKVINNGIDKTVFVPTHGDFRRKYGLEDKKVLVGVAFDWGKRKGLDVFISLAKRLPSDYRLVLVGTNDSVDSILPDNVVSIHKTNNQRELAEIYTAADLFVNPTREENYPTVNMEALSCGTPVLTFKTGGSPEIIDESCGSVVEKDDTDALFNEIIRICNERPYTEEACLKRAEAFDMNDRFDEYIRLYEELV